MKTEAEALVVEIAQLPEWTHLYGQGLKDAIYPLGIKPAPTGIRVHIPVEVSRRISTLASTIRTREGAQQQRAEQKAEEALREIEKFTGQRFPEAVRDFALAAFTREFAAPPVPEPPLPPPHPYRRPR